MMGFLTAGLPGASEPLPAEFLEKLNAKYSPRSKEYVCKYEGSNQVQSQNVNENNNTCVLVSGTLEDCFRFLETRLHS